ncbi:putative pentatricopeptide repeat-containing protein [Tripterygium wilfordii]|uniref:Putative pentatricopeptide repeat-containing protein n=1 Tax=Tripterygium wilfordii TaxID=458696 RepID=A0A7J7DHQ2_TRIWF|nr:putative pentatricopeptide repeat-containing protein [Tripterygium wilfordii]
MRWACSITNPLLKRVQFPSLVTIATDGVVNTLEFFHQYQTRSHGSSVSGDYTNVLMVEALHAQSVKDGSLQNLSMNNYLLDLYVKSSNLHCAHKLFDEMPTQDVRSWTILVSGFARNGYPTVVFECFRKMQTEGVCPNQITLSIVFKCCSSLREFRNGMAIHGWILRNGIAEDIVLENSILDHYVKCRAFDYAIRLFGLMKQKDTVSWNIMIGAYLLLGDVEKSVDLFRSLPFKDVASWNTLLNGLTRNGFERAAVKLLYEMVESGPPLNEFSFSVALVMVSSLSILKLGKQIHSQVLRLGIHNDGFIRNSLVDMYCKCGKMGEALAIFRKMPMENLTVQSEKAATYDKSMEEIVLCSSIVSGYVRNGDYKDAMKTFSTLVCKHVKVDGFTLTSIVSACANARNLGYGRQVHGYIQKVGQKTKNQEKCFCANGENLVIAHNIVQHRGHLLERQSGTKEDDEESSSSDHSMKNSMRFLQSLPKPHISTGFHRLFRTLSHLFVYKEDMEDGDLEMEMEIGGPTDVKHVTHIGWDNLIGPELLSLPSPTSPPPPKQFE